MSGPCYWFQRNAVVETDEGYWHDGRDATIQLFVDGKISVLFYPKGRQLDSCTFAYDLAGCGKTAVASHESLS
jgi:hypothetical protein